MKIVAQSYYVLKTTERNLAGFQSPTTVTQCLAQFWMSLKFITIFGQ
jgi:hypothetical protein